MVAKHPDNNVEFTPRTSKDTILNLLAEQNIDLMEKIINLNTDIKTSFDKLTGDLREIHEDADRKDKAGKEKVDLLENNRKIGFYISN